MKQLLALTLLLVSCGDAGGGSGDVLGAAVSQIRCGNVSDMPEMEGLSEDTVAEKLGKAAEVTEFTLGGGVPEFRIELLNLYPLPENDARLIREKIWESGGCNIAIWFAQDNGEWRSVDSLTWPDGVEF